MNVQLTHPCGLASIRMMRFFPSSTARVHGDAYWSISVVFEHIADLREGIDAAKRACSDDAVEGRSTLVIGVISNK